MSPAVPRISAAFGAILALAACATTASPSASQPASATPEPAGRTPEVLAVACAPVPFPFDPGAINLTGAWAGDDGGVYYLRQVGSVVWWNGMSEREGSPMDLGRVWNNVGRGVIDGLRIDVEWSDVPRSEFMSNGTLILNIQDDGTGNTEIVTLSQTGDFGNELFTPCLPVELQVADYVEAYGGDSFKYVDILTLEACDELDELKGTVTAQLNSSEAGSPEFREALGYSNAISDRQLALHC